MDEAIKNRWTAALRSGEYPQGTGVLNRDGKFCCLGVLCEIAEEDGIVVKVPKFNTPNEDAVLYRSVRDSRDVGRGVLPESVMEWAGLESVNPLIYPDDPNDSLAELNDEGSSFSEIADLIDKYL